MNLYVNVGNVENIILYYYTHGTMRSNHRGF